MSSDIDADLQDGGGTPLEATSRTRSLVSHPRRVQLLEVLDHDSTRTVSALASELVARANGEEGHEGREAERSDARHTVQIELVHQHLPHLADYDLVEWDRETGAVSLVAEATIDEAADERVTVETNGGEVTISDPTRIDVLSVLEDESLLTLEELAAAITADDAEPDRAVMTALHHSHLPAMADAGLLQYDSSIKLVSARDGASDRPH